MKKAQTWVFLAAMAWGAIAATLAATGKPVSRVTAGELSRDLSVVARNAGATEVSRNLMTLDFGVNADVPLTEGDAVAILQKAGLPGGDIQSRSRPDSRPGRCPGAAISLCSCETRGQGRIDRGEDRPD